MPSRSRRIRAVLVAAALAAAAVAYWPGVGGPFLFDDVERILRVPPLAMTVPDAQAVRDAMYSGGQGYPSRGLARLTFALDHYFAGGFDPRRFKIVNVAIHVLNGALVYWLAVLLVRARAAGGARREPDRVVAYLPLLAAALWVLHPIQLTAVLYVVQRMTSLAATFVFAGLVVFAVGRARFAGGRRLGTTLMLAGIGGGTVLGILAKENAALLPLFALLVDLTFFRADWRGPRRRGLLAFHGLVVGLPAAALAAAVVLLPGFTDFLFAGYRDLDHGPVERLLTQSRALFFYLGLILVPDVRRMGIFHDDFATSAGILEPWTTLPSVLGLVVLALLALRGLSRPSVLGFGILWFLAGHAVESTVLPLEPVFEHRNYVPSFGVLLAVAYGLLRLGDVLTSGRRWLDAAVWLGVLALALATLVRASTWSAAPTLLRTEVRHHPGSYRARLGYAASGLPRTADVGVRYGAYQAAARLEPRAVVPLVEMAKLAAVVEEVLDTTGALDRPPAAPRGGMDLMNDPLVLDREALDRQRVQIDRAVIYRLVRYPVNTETGIALVRLADCVIAGGACRLLADEAFNWHRIALANARSGPEVNAVLALSLAKLLARAGEREDAIAHARRAGRLAPDNLAYRLTEARLYLLLEARDEARRVLAEVNARRGRSGYLERDFARVAREVGERE